jgi:7-cyano-7-deazaguanine reductase
VTEGSDLEGLTLLGSNTRPSKKLETFPNHHSGRRYVVRLETDEFTCVCPATEQPDFATITVEYIPNEKILESKSFKLYLWSYRNEGVFHEHVTNTILDDLVEVLEPHWCWVQGAFNVRGGIGITVEAEHGSRDGFPPSRDEPADASAEARPKTVSNTRDTPADSATSNTA